MVIIDQVTNETAARAYHPTGHGKIPPITGRIHIDAEDVQLNTCEQQWYIHKGPVKLTSLRYAIKKLVRGLSFRFLQVNLVYSGAAKVRNPSFM
jgi:hypothetical protein